MPLESGNYDNLTRSSHKSPIELFEMFWNVTHFEDIVTQSEQYSREKIQIAHLKPQKKSWKFISYPYYIRIYSPLPIRDWYWCLDDDLNNMAISKAISRNRFREILKNLHFAENSELTQNDKFGKVRPLIKHLNGRFMAYMPKSTKNVDVDESMIPYYSQHSYTQSMQDLCLL